VQKREVLVRIEGVTGAVGDRAVDSLRRAINESGADVTVARENASNDHQDFGATIVLILGAPAAIAAAKAIPDIARAVQSWATRTNAGSITIETRDRRVSVKGVDSKDLAAVAAALGSGSD
jgi:hypothetical protein